VYVEKCWDEVWVAVKFQTNLEIAGSLRNSFRASLGRRIMEVEPLFGRGARHGLLNSDKLRIPLIFIRESDGE
jgi:hypothetical protein